MEAKTALELLAPAKDAETGIAAVNFGADAVYIGAPRFGARREASNALPDIEKLVRYAHRFHARVYAALNTVLFDHELEEARKIILGLHDCGVDAVIIQDMGILRLDLPPIEWHASTQTDNFTPGKARFLEKAGFKRIILARELSLEQIREIRQYTGADLEFFVHGSLCVSMSGLCYMSLASGNRSGNRGACAQPCRKKYDLEDASGKTIISQKYLLSLRDLNLSAEIPSLAEAGISSFKIEGRLKDLNYVRNVTAYYRKKLDGYLAGNPVFRRKSSGTVKFDFEPVPEKTFSRGHTTYFLKGRQKGIASFDSPKSVGEFIGTVQHTDGNLLDVETDRLISNNDGLSFFTKEGELQGARVNMANGRQLFLATPAIIPPGTRLFRNYDHLFEEKLKNSRTHRKIRLSLQVQEIPGGIRISGKDEDGIQLDKEFPLEKQPSLQPEKTKALFMEQLRKTGGTDFETDEIAVSWEKPFFLPLSVINGMRRDFLDSFMEKRLLKHPQPEPAGTTEDFPYIDKVITATGNVTNALAVRFYQEHGVTDMVPALEVSRNFRGERLMSMKHCLKYQFNHCPRIEGSETIPGKEPLFLRDGEKKFRLEFDCRECTMNLYKP